MASNASTLIPSDPSSVMLLRRLTPNLAICSTPFHRFSRIAIGGRGTIVRLASGNLAVFSPVALTDRVKSELSQFGNGQVRYITALDQEHHIFVSDWLKEYPEATVLAPETLPDLRKKQGYPAIPDAQWKLFRKDRKTWTVSEEFDREFDMEYVPAHANHELVFNHRPSRTLIEADLLFNLPATEQHSKTGQPTNGAFLSGPLTRLFNAINNTQGEALWQRRFIWYAISAGDRPGYNASVSRIAGWDFDQIIPCHGNVIETGGKGIFEKVMQWHLEAGRKGQ